MSAKEAWKLIQALKRERYSHTAICQGLGLRSRNLQLHTEIITVRNYLKVRRLYRLATGEDAGT